MNIFKFINLQIKYRLQEQFLLFFCVPRLKVL